MSKERMGSGEKENISAKIFAPFINIINVWFDSLRGKKKR